MKCLLVFVTLVYFFDDTCAQLLPPGGLVWQNCTRPNEVYNCGSVCQSRCSTLGELCPIVNMKCKDACYCIDGYARDDNDVCIKVEDCPPKPKSKNHH